MRTRRRRLATRAVPVGFDPYSFTVAFKGVLLEGLEVAFIVLTFGANQHRIALAALAAGAAIACVAAAGVVVRAPLARAPENAMKFAVGVMLTSFGTFWGAEGAGAVVAGRRRRAARDRAGAAGALLGFVAVIRRASPRLRVARDRASKRGCAVSLALTASGTSSSATTGASRLASSPRSGHRAGRHEHGRRLVDPAAGVVALLADSLRRAARASGPGERPSAPERSLQLAGAIADLAEQHAHLLDACSQLAVADLDRQHRVLQPAEPAVRPCDRLDGAVDLAAGVVGADVRLLHLELAGGQLVALRELAYTRFNRP